MIEKILSIEGYNALDIYGVKDAKLELIKGLFSRVKIIARGDLIKIVGEAELIADFETRFALLLENYDRFGVISDDDVIQIMGSVTGDGYINSKNGDDVLVYGNSGLRVRAVTPNQRLLVSSIGRNEMVFAIGPAGTGKTYTAVALAVRALKNKEVKRIVLTRPAVEAGENLGFLPGDMKEKLDPYMMPLYDALRDMIPHQRLKSFMEDGTIEIAPLAFMRGRTLGNAFVILDEAQNATEGQLKMFLTRMGKNSKFVITGDVTQIDLPNRVASGLVGAKKLLEGIEGIDFIMLEKQDVIRHKLVTRIINAYEQNELKGTAKRS